MSLELLVLYNPITSPYYIRGWTGIREYDNKEASIRSGNRGNSDFKKGIC